MSPPWRWTTKNRGVREPAPGFMPHGTCLIVPKSEWKGFAPLKIKGPEGKLYTEQEREALGRSGE
jgi:hypothetical protein